MFNGFNPRLPRSTLNDTVVSYLYIKPFRISDRNRMMTAFNGHKGSINGEVPTRIEVDDERSEISDDSLDLFKNNSADLTDVRASLTKCHSKILVSARKSKK